MHVTTVSSKHQVTLSKPLREKLGIKPGDKMLVEVKGHSLVLTAASLVPRDQLYFWSERWQDGEREAEDDVRAGRLSRPYRPAETGALVRALDRDGKTGRRR